MWLRCWFTSKAFLIISKGFWRYGDCSKKSLPHRLPQRLVDPRLPPRPARPEPLERVLADAETVFYN